MKNETRSPLVQLITGLLASIAGTTTYRQHGEAWGWSVGLIALGIIGLVVGGVTLLSGDRRRKSSIG